MNTILHNFSSEAIDSYFLMHRIDSSSSWFPNCVFYNMSKVFKWLKAFDLLSDSHCNQNHMPEVTFVV